MNTCSADDLERMLDEKLSTPELRNQHSWCGAGYRVVLEATVSKDVKTEFRDRYRRRGYEVVFVQNSRERGESPGRVMILLLEYQRMTMCLSHPT